MTIQIPNPGTGNGATGDNEFVLWSKVKDNFSDQTNAASRLVGTAAGQVPLAQDTIKAAHSFNGILLSLQSPKINCNDLDVGTRILGSINDLENMPPSIYDDDIYVIDTIKIFDASKMQIAHGYTKNIRLVRTHRITWSEWSPITPTKATYTTTTAAGANVVVEENGRLMRSTSSERYKNILAPLELDDARYADAMALKPIVYRSTADADNPAYHYYSFSAEELGAYDPAFTLWRETETVTDADGNVTEQPLAERQAEGININALLAMNHAIAIKQDKLIKALEARIEILEAK